MHLKRAQARVGLLAVFTGELFLDLGSTLELFMLGQATKGQVTIAAAIALVSSYSVVFTTGIVISFGCKVGALQFKLGELGLLAVRDQ